MTKFKMGDTVKIIGNQNNSANNVGDIGIITEGNPILLAKVHVAGRLDKFNWTLPEDMELFTGDVPIGYTGLPKDMNLKDGDVCENKDGGLYAMRGVRLGMIPVNDCQGDYTLVSRANKPQENQWAISGDTEVDYTTHDVAEYRGKPVAMRKKKPVIRASKARVYAGRYLKDATVVTTDGVPDWSTLKVK
jgi:hypothetical protein